MSFPGDIKLNIKPTSNFGEEARKGRRAIFCKCNVCLTKVYD